jgi:hypothetical protein
MARPVRAPSSRYRTPLRIAINGDYYGFRENGILIDPVPMATVDISIDVVSLV